MSAQSDVGLAPFSGTWAGLFGVFGLVALALCWAPGAVRADAGVSMEEGEPLRICLEAAHDDGLARCRAESVADCPDRPVDRTLCLTRVTGQWTWASMRIASEIITRGEGREAFDKQGFLNDLEARMSQERERCTDFPIGQELALAECVLDARVDEVRWLRGLRDGMEPRE